MKVRIYTIKSCGYCRQALALLKERHIDYQEISVDNNSALRAEISQKVGGYPTVPMIFIDDQFIGGYTDLVQLEQKGKL